MKPILDESMLGDCNMEVPEGEVTTTGTVPEVYADAINQRRKHEKDYKEDFKEQDDVTDKFVKEQEKTVNSKLDESLLEAFDEKLYKDAENISDSINEFVKKAKTAEQLSEQDAQRLTKVANQFADFAVRYSTIMDNENLFEAVEEPPVKKKRTRGPKVVDWAIDISDTDLWLQVYDELDAALGEEGEGKGVHRFMKAKKGERYQYVVPFGDNDIMVAAPNKDDFDFAKRVADYYGVKMEGPFEDRNKRTNEYYKYYVIIRIPKDADPIQPHD